VICRNPPACAGLGGVDVGDDREVSGAGGFFRRVCEISMICPTTMTATMANVIVRQGFPAFSSGLLFALSSGLLASGFLALTLLV